VDGSGPHAMGGAGLVGPVGGWLGLPIFIGSPRLPIYIL
jgi:hypothetical protein